MKALPYFDVNAETTLQVDASKKGLRACLIQKGKVVYYASRALTKTEQNYQNLEQEALGTMWGMEKFHYFLYVADALSCVTPMHPEDNIQLPIIAVNMITTCILMSVESQDSFSNKLDQLRKSTAQDNQLTRLSHYINTGFPCDKKNLLTDFHEFWPHRETLSVKSRLITCGNRIIVPREMRPEMLQYIHEGHQGKERCLLQARNTVFWPKMMYDVQELIERCIICQEHGRSQPIIGTSQELPPFPWHTLATDIFYWKRMDFLIVTDVFSKYFLVRKLANSTSAAICAELATIVTELGLPHIIRSDNGPCYNSKEFQQFLQCYNITHHTSSPHHPRSNGFVERMVGVAKKLMDKAVREGKPWISGLYEYRVTPQSGSIASPLQLITQCTPREKDLPQLPSTLGAQEMYQTQQELMRRQGQIHSSRSQTDKVQEQPVDRTRES